MEDPQIHVVKTLQAGVAWANELGKELGKTDAADWPKEKMVVAALTYAAAMASETSLDEDSWLDLAIMAFRGVSVGP
ncbi:MAG: hypothetical protein GY906_24745 [bacterium]|nr:hypothetical protein [bacterium]